jgi:hypothetical protein
MNDTRAPAAVALVLLWLGGMFVVPHDWFQVYALAPVWLAVGALALIAALEAGVWVLTVLRR